MKPGDGPTAARPAARRGLWLSLAVAAAQLLLFAWLDHRPPNDHDPFYTDASIPWVLQLRDASLLSWPGVLTEHVLAGDLHPRLAQTVLVAALGLFGESVAVFRLANLPFVLLLVLGTWLLARELRVRHPGLVAFAVATLPLAVHASRKWDLQFHAAALTPFGLWLGVLALRRVRPRWWLLFGAFQGLRLYSHPIIAPDVALTLLFVGVLGGWRDRARPGVRLLGPVLAAFAAHAVGCMALGIVGDAGWSLPNYWAQRGDYGQGWWWAEADLAARAGLFVEVLSEGVWLHLLPPLAALVLFGLMATAALGLRRSVLLEADRGVWPMHALLILLAAAELPVVGLAVSNGAFVGDWLFVLPGLLIASIWGAEVALVGRPRLGRTLAAGVVLQGLVVVALPLALGATGPELLERADWYDRGPLRFFVRSSSGRHYVTHHVPSGLGHPAEALAAALDEEGQQHFELLNLTWDPAHGGEAGCRLGDPDDPEGWAWAVPRGARDEARRPLSGWPFVFAGGVPPVPSRPDALRTDPAERAVRLVRLWLQPTPDWSNVDVHCVPRALLGPSFLPAARGQIRERFGGGELRMLPDPAGQLVGRVVEWDRGRAYVGLSYLLTDSVPDVYLELQAEGGPQRTPDGLGEPGGHGTEAAEGQGRTAN